MKTKIFALCLAIVATVTLIALPKVQAYIPEPLFGLDWRPDACADGSPGFYLCQMWYSYLVIQNNSAIDASMGDVQVYTQIMGENAAFTCEHPAGYFGGSGDETFSWCLELYGKWINDYQNEFGNGCSGICFQKEKPKWMTFNTSMPYVKKEKTR